MTKKPTLPGLDLATEHAREPPGAVPLLTVIVPVYNEAETISEQLARIVAAPYSKQVIVVDDGSTDGTAGARGVAGRRPVQILAARGQPRGRGRNPHRAALCPRPVYDHPGRRPGIRSGGLSALGRTAAGGRDAGGLRLAVFARDAAGAILEESGRRGPHDEVPRAKCDEGGRPERDECAEGGAVGMDEKDGRGRGW